MPPKIEERFIDFGVLSATEASSILFAIINSNPIEVKTLFLFSVTLKISCLCCKITFCFLFEAGNKKLAYHRRWLINRTCSYRERQQKHGDRKPSRTGAVLFARPVPGEWASYCFKLEWVFPAQVKEQGYVPHSASTVTCFPVAMSARHCWGLVEPVYPSEAGTE